MPMSPKTPPGQTREQVFRFVQQRLVEGRPPTIREVQEAFRFRSVQTAREHLETLAAEGRLVKEPGISRGYSLPGAAKTGGFFPVPLLGRVQAGAPIVPVEEVEDYIPVKARDGEDLFALRIRGDSMKGAGILHGDVVIVRRGPAAEEGDIVVALVGDEATVKRLRFRDNRPVLFPENPDFEPIIAREIAVLGRVIEVRRIFGDPARRAPRGRRG